jgi:hypothetical protein
MDVEIKTEKEFNKWFENNFKSLGYDQIIKRDNGTFPDVVMSRNGEKIRVELETLSSNFLIHGHDPKLVDEVVCIKNDFNLEVPTIEVNSLKFVGNKIRISATVEKSTRNIIDALVKTKRYRNKSHVIEAAIELLEVKDEK